jgi:hypothetical protein
MTIIMDDSKIQTVAQIQEVLKSFRGMTFKGKSRKDKYAWVVSVLKRLDYYALGKNAKGSVKTYLQQMAGFSRAQLTGSSAFRVGKFRSFFQFPMNDVMTFSLK